MSVSKFSEYWAWFFTYFHEELFWLHLLSTLVFLLYCTCSWRLCNSSFFDVPTHWTVFKFWKKKLRKGYPRPRLLIYYKLRAFKCIDSYIFSIQRWEKKARKAAISLISRSISSSFLFAILSFFFIMHGVKEEGETSGWMFLLFDKIDVRN